MVYQATAVRPETLGSVGSIVVRLRTHLGTLLEVYIYDDGGLNIYERTMEQIAQNEFAVDCEERSGGWAIHASCATLLTQALLVNNFRQAFD